MKKIFGIFIIFVQVQVYANMANPVMEGTLGGRPFVSQYVDVVHEDLIIKIDKRFEHALFKVKYHINSSKNGTQIPFLFYASEYLDSFTVKIDGKNVSTNEIPYDYKVAKNSKFKDFSYFFDSSTDTNSILIKDSPEGGFHVSLHDMIYFETDISEGEHIIEVSYRAAKWTNASSWANQYSFRYALSPAKYWKSFGTIRIKIDATEFDKELNTNLGLPKKGATNSKAEWEFNQLPIEILKINYNPRISKTAQALINITPIGLAYITGCILVIIHLLIIIWHRKKNRSKRFSLPVIIGSILIPLLFLISWMNYYKVIDFYIGEHASRRHGYTFFVFVLYPVILPIYWLTFRFFDKRLKKKYKPQQQEQMYN